MASLEVAPFCAGIGHAAGIATIAAATSEVL